MVRSFLGLKEDPQLRVLLYHDISPELENNFMEQLAWMNRGWDFLDPLEFVEIIEGKKKLEKNSLLLTFDDGFCSNYDVAKKVLDSLDIKAIFFIVPGYMKLKKTDNWRKYIAENIYPDIPLDEIPAQWQNMGLDQVKELIQMGHQIGSHTLTHARLSKIRDHELLSTEIIHSQSVLRDALHHNIDHFAYTFGDVDSFSSEAYRLARVTYSYIYTGLGGNNAKVMNSKLILRDAIFANDSRELIGSILEGASDWYFFNKISKLKSWV